MRKNVAHCATYLVSTYGKETGADMLRSLMEKSTSTSPNLHIAINALF